MKYEPFNDDCGLVSCAIALKVAIDRELDNYDFNMRHFLELGGYDAIHDNFLLAMAYKNKADAHDWTLDVLHRLAHKFKANLTLEAIDDINKTFDTLGNCNNRKAG